MGVLDKLKNVMGLGPENYEDEYVGLNNEIEQNKAAKSEAYNKPLNVNTQLQVILVKPERYEDAAGIADNLNAKHTVVLNLEATNKEVSKRLLDFLSGVAYANGGQIKKVASNTYIITPYNVDIMGNLLDIDEAESFLKKAR